ncbi:MAG: PQQ-binding-like beta-propeller repeat protein [Verrucomicrobiota bacterium]
MRLSIWLLSISVASVTIAAPPKPNSDNAELLARIDNQPLPKGYTGVNHQPYVDKSMAILSPAQRARVGQLWKEKQRLSPDMPNRGQSFVKILAHVAGTPAGHPLISKPATTEEGLVGKATPVTNPLPPVDPKAAATQWHHWRGPDATGVSPTATPPAEWSETKNVRWKVPIDGRGSSTPIIWNDQVFVLSAINTGKVDPSLPKPEDQPERIFGIKHPNTEFELVVHCLDRKSGEEIWRRTAARKIPHEGHHGDNNYASASPTTDGERLYCSFGSGGIFCYDLNGNKLWERDLGEVAMGASLGEGTSPVYHDGRLIIVRDNHRQSYIEVLDAATGETLWKANRNEGNTWATPRVIEHSGKTQVITPGTNLIRSYDLDTGEIIWQCGGLTNNAIPCPVVFGDYVYCMTGYKGHALLALPLSAKGDITGSDQILWQHDEGTPYVPSPLLYDGQLYFTQSNQAILTCLDAATGDIIIDRTRLPDMTNVYSSPVGADGRVYLTGRNGEVLVIEHGNELKVLALNELDDRNFTSPALAGNQIFLRGDQFLYCIEE